MIYFALILVGLCLGSFVNALVWRIHEQSKKSNGSRPELSIAKGRSMCPDCHHELAAKDLFPVISWLTLRGRCRYCAKPISAQYPIVEAATAILFVISYLCWPEAVNGIQTLLLGLWLIILTGLMALLVYDLKWMLLPNRIVYPLSWVAGLYALISIFSSDHILTAIINTGLAVAVGGGIFYLLFQLSDGRWIGGGDVKLGWLLGLVVGTPGRALLLIFLAAVLGCLASLPLLAIKRLKRHSVVPFGPFLILATIVVQLYGQSILDWYSNTFFPGL